jgi:hypothetical protein
MPRICRFAFLASFWMAYRHYTGKDCDGCGECGVLQRRAYRPYSREVVRPYVLERQLRYSPRVVPTYPRRHP